ncbi:hypothetical protein XELAEV_18005990mg [Xenopus laevis]|uniref:Uncharacterized protein n=1 Tax=Xenopus laevis TaxID=8355 RepID=A0A974DZQ0_XENLA|nr:hypothetical protein XELAEV_18005990mg [Xenopus laevis]
MGQKKNPKKETKKVTAYFAQHSRSPPRSSPSAILEQRPRDPSPPQTAMSSTEGDTAPASAQQIKEMLTELRTTLKGDLKQLSKDLRREIQDIGERPAHIEEKMGEFVEAHNDLAESCTKVQTEADALRDKVNDLEDRSRRNNLPYRPTQSDNARRPRTGTLYRPHTQNPNPNQGQRQRRLLEMLLCDFCFSKARI